MKVTFLVMTALLIATPCEIVNAQDDPRTSDSLPNPYETIKDWAKLPSGRVWGSTSAVEIDKDGKSIWVAERCGQNTCLDRATNQMSNLSTILKFDATGKLVKSFGEGMLIFAHGIFVDNDGNVWVTDGQDNAPAPAGARGAGPAGPGGSGSVGPPAGATKGHQVYKYSPDGKLLMTLGKPGGAAEPDYFYQPNDVVVARNGDIFVSEGHQIGNGTHRILKFSKEGKLIKTWGKRGSGPGEFETPHGLAMDSRGRLFVADRNNNRIQIFDQDGKFIDQWKQYSRPSGVYIDNNDIIYVADSESGSVSQNHDGWKRGIRIGSAKDGKLIAFIPDPETRTRPEFTGTSAAEGVAADAQGNVYGAEVGPRTVKRYVKKK